MHCNSINSKTQKSVTGNKATKIALIKRLPCTKSVTKLCHIKEGKGGGGVNIKVISINSCSLSLSFWKENCWCYASA